MAQGIPEAESSQMGATRPNNGPDDPCESCRGRGSKLVTMRRAEATAGAAAETELLGRALTDCLMCSGTGEAGAVGASVVDGGSSAQAGG
jgi:hypothetical protein